MGNFVEMLYEVMVRPQATMRVIAAWRPVKQAMAVFFISTTVTALMLHAALSGPGAGNLVMMAVGIHFFFGLITWILGAAVFNLVAEYFGGQANGMGLFATLGFTYWPKVFMAPVWAVAVFLPVGLRPWVWLTGGIAIAAWTILLTVIALRASHGLSAQRAVLTLLTPPLVIGVLLLLLLMMGIAALPWR
ncbi:MAG TPA: YIP1 family protein [Patescibacteria group bacterium]|nr:YIP1 family protein [Patescibacteria group bacterium]